MFSAFYFTRKVAISDLLISIMIDTYFSENLIHKMKRNVNIFIECSVPIVKIHSAYVCYWMKDI